jgi:NTP pyrophosphatase (non-canonical NTP hydrolase)
MTIVSNILWYCKQADDHHPERTQYSVLAAAVSEMGELAEEVAIEQGDLSKQTGPDGVIGEAVDVIAAVVDLIYLTNPNITEKELSEMVNAKCCKWIRKIQERKKPE